MYNVRGCYVSDSDGLISIYFSYLKQGTNHRTCGKHIFYLKMCFLVNSYMKRQAGWLDHTYLKVYYVIVLTWLLLSDAWNDHAKHMPTQQTDLNWYKAQMIGLTSGQNYIQ